MQTLEVVVKVLQGLTAVVALTYWTRKNLKDKDLE